MSSEREQAIQRVAKQKFNINPGEEIPVHIRQQIIRTTILPDDKSNSNNYQSVHDRPPGMSTVDFFALQASAKRAAEWEQKQLAEMHPPVESDTVKACKQRIDLCQQKLRAARSNINEQRHHQRELEQAHLELQQQIQTEAAEAQAAETRAAIEADEMYQNAKEHGEACLRLATTDAEYKEIYLQLQSLKSVSSPEQIPGAIKTFWKAREQSELQEANEAAQAELPAMENAAHATRDAVQAQEKTLEAKHRAELARIESERGQ